MSSIDLVLERLGHCEWHKGYYMASCPAHDDQKPSLSIKEGVDGKVLLHCFAGCEKPKIVAALGLTLGDLFPASTNGSRNGHEKKDGKPTAAWDIRDAGGELHAVHVRFDRNDGKECLWKLPSASGWGLKGRKLATLPLYRSEHLQDWPEDMPVIVVEGEKAADALSEVYPAVLGTVTGAGGTPGAEALGVLRGRRVILWPDNDEEGRLHMTRIAEALCEGVAAQVSVFGWVDGPPKGDAADHPAVTGRDPQALEKLLIDLRSAPRRGPEEDAAKPEPIGVLLSDVVAEKVEWLWRGRVPKGKLTLLDGDPAKGKSALTIYVAACVTVGRAFPDGAPCEAGGVALLNAEDGLADTILPRFQAAGGDPSRVVSLATVPDENGHERLLSIPEDIQIIERGIERVNADLVVIDPLMAFLSGKLNAHKDQDVRKALAPLAAMAERTGAAVLVVRHLNQATGQNPLYRGGGSIGIIGQARSALVVAEDPEDDCRRVLASLKNNLSEPAPSLVFTVVSAKNGAACVEWKGQTELKADQLLCAPADPEERSALDEAKDFLLDALQDGPRHSKAVKNEAREADVSEATLRRAKVALSVRATKESDGSWSWSLPGGAGKARQDAQGEQQGSQAPEHEHLERLPTNRPILEGKGEQGAQGVQGTNARVDGRVAPARDWREHPLDCECIECL